MKRVKVFLLVLGAVGCADAQSYLISGVGPLGAVTGVSADNISLAPPVRIALDSAAKSIGEIFGTTYVATDSQVFAIGGFPRTVTAIIGTAYRGFGGDGGPAAEAQFDRINGLAVAANGDLYISDANNNRVRKVHNGIVTTYAGSGTSAFLLLDGGPATLAGISSPTGLFLDPAGNLYVADSGHLRIRRIDAASGIITTVAGGGSSDGEGVAATSAKLGFVQAVVLDAGGDMFIAEARGDEGGPVVSMVSASTGIIRAIAGVPDNDGTGQPVIVNTNSPTTTTVDNPTDLAIDNSTGRLWIATGRGLYVLSNQLHSISRAPDPALPAPFTGSLAISGIAVDGSGTVLLASHELTQVYRFLPDAGASGATITGSYSQDFGNGLLGTTPDGLTPAQSQGGLCDVTYDADGSLYYGDTDNQIRKINPNYSSISTIAGTGQAVASGDNGPALNAAFTNTCHIKADGHGHLFVAGDDGGGSIRRIDLTTGFVNTVASVNGARQLAVDKAGNLFYADNGGFMWRLDAITSAVTLVAGNGGTIDSGDGGPASSAGLASPKGVAMDSAGFLYIGTLTHIRRVDPSTGLISTFAGGGSAVTDHIPALQAAIIPGYLAFDPRGNLIFPDLASNQFEPEGNVDYETVRRITPAGMIDTIAGNGGPNNRGFGDFGNSGDGALSVLSAIAVNDSIAISPLGDIAILQTDSTLNDIDDGFPAYIDSHYVRVLQQLPMPFLSAAFQSKTDGAATGNRVWTLNVANTGPGASLNPRVTNVTETVNGPGPVSVFSTVPMSLGTSIPSGSSAPLTLNLFFPVTSPVTRISMTVTITDDSGQIYTNTFNNLFR